MKYLLIQFNMRAESFHPSQDESSQLKNFLNRMKAKIYPENDIF